MSFLEKFNDYYVNFDVFDKNEYKQSFDYEEDDSDYDKLVFTYLVSRDTLEKFKQIIGYVNHDFVEETTGEEIDASTVTNDDILDNEKIDRLGYTIDNTDYEPLNYIVREDIKESDLCFLSEKCFKLLKMTFPNIKPVKKVLYWKEDGMKVEIHNIKLSVVFLNDKELRQQQINPYNIDEYTMDIYVSRFMSGYDLEIILKLIGFQKNYTSIDKLNMFMTENSQLSDMDKRMLLRGNLNVVEIRTNNLLKYEIYNDRTVIFYFTNYGNDFKLSFKIINDLTPMAMEQAGADYKPSSGYYYRYKDDSDDDLMEGENDGKIGLGNIGNTCFMNSALQCMLHTDVIKEFMMSPDLKDEINLDNPLGSKGELLEAFGELFRSYYKTKGTRISPYQFKRVMNKHLVTFEGYGQHDSQEFLSQMLDAVHEDVNRILNKPYTTTIEGKIDDDDNKIARESWINFLKRNYSVFIDNFFGQFKSTVSCHVCNHTSVSFDPYQIISLSIPIVQKERFSFYFLSTDHISKAKKFYFHARSFQHFNDINMQPIIESYSEKVEVPIERLRFVILGFSRVGQVIKSSENLSAFHNLNFSSSSEPKAFLVELADQDMANLNHEDAIEVYLSTNYELYDEQVNKLEKYSYEYRKLSYEFDENPIFVKFLYMRKSNTIRDLYVAVLRKFHHKTSLHDEDKHGDKLLGDKFFIDLWDLLENKLKDRRFFYIVINGKRCGGNSMETTLGTFLEDSNKLDVKVFLYFPKNTSTKISLQKFLNCSIDYSEDLNFDSGNLDDYKSEYNIESLLETFSEPEVLDENNKWFCGKCKEHVQATKRIEIYKCPKYLIIHLKKLKYQAKKIPMITFPKKNLDMEGFVLSKTGSNGYNIKPEEFIAEEQLKYYQRKNKEFAIKDTDERKGLKYDLYGVVNHYGSQNFGHYTSSVLVDGEWIEFNDSSVHKATETDVVGEGAYILFYKKNF